MFVVRSVVAIATVALLAPCVVANSDHSSGDVKCPGSPAGNHAWLSIEAMLSVSCDAAKEEILARVAGQSDKTWDDPHGDGIYALKSESDGGVTIERKSSNARYTDEMLFNFAASGSGCKVMACSESQGSSYLDQSTNLCNSWNLVCGAQEQCCHVKHEVATFSYSVVGKSAGGQDNVDVCLGGQGGSGGGFAGDRQTKCPAPAGATPAAGAISSTLAAPVGATSATDAASAGTTASPISDSSTLAVTPSPTASVSTQASFAKSVSASFVTSVSLLGLLWSAFS